MVRRVGDLVLRSSEVWKASRPGREGLPSSGSLSTRPQDALLCFAQKRYEEANLLFAKSYEARKFQWPRRLFRLVLSLSGDLNKFA